MIMLKMLFNFQKTGYTLLPMTVAEKTAKKFRGPLFSAAPCIAMIQYRTDIRRMVTDCRC